MKAVKEIISHIDGRPNEWIKTRCGTGIKNELYKIHIDSVGNTAILSICNLYIDDVNIPITCSDRFRIEKAVNRWYKNINLITLLK